MKALLIALLISSTASAKVIVSDIHESPKVLRVAVIDTGFDFKSNWTNYDGKKKDEDGYTLRKPKVCASGHTDYTGTGLSDENGHGTHVAGIIAKFAENSSYCLVILKFWTKGVKDPLKNEIKAINKAIELKVDVINFSGGGTELDTEECAVVKKALDRGIAIVVAAGNERSNINETPYYPAMCDDRVVVVKNVDRIGNLVPSSNFTDSVKGSREMASEKGLKVLSFLPNNNIGYMTGTSQAAPTKVGKMLKNWGK